MASDKDGAVSELEIDTYPIKEGLDGLTVEIHHGLAEIASSVRGSLSASTGGSATVADGLFAISESIDNLAQAASRIANILERAIGIWEHPRI